MRFIFSNGSLPPTSYVELLYLKVIRVSALPNAAAGGSKAPRNTVSIPRFWFSAHTWYMEYQGAKANKRGAQTVSS